MKSARASQAPGAQATRDLDPAFQAIRRGIFTIKPCEEQLDWFATGVCPSSSGMAAAAGVIDCISFRAGNDLRALHTPTTSSYEGCVALVDCLTAAEGGGVMRLDKMYAHGQSLRVVEFETLTAAVTRDGHGTFLYLTVPFTQRLEEAQQLAQEVSSERKLRGVPVYFIFNEQAYKYLNGKAAGSIPV